jgi:acetyltransferase-like isoleucine patch superfamily enzyme
MDDGLFFKKFLMLPFAQKAHVTVQLLRGLALRGQFQTPTWVLAGPGVHVMRRQGQLTGGRVCVLAEGVRIAVIGNSERVAILHIGEATHLQARTHINCMESVWIGDHCAISWDCEILDTDIHQVLSLDGMGLPRTAAVRIEDRVWIGTRAIILKGVTIGEGSVIGAGSVVTGNIPPYSLAAGNPARVLRTIDGWRP